MSSIRAPLIRPTETYSLRLICYFLRRRIIQSMLLFQICCSLHWCLWLFLSDFILFLIRPLQASAYSYQMGSLPACHLSLHYTTSSFPLLRISLCFPVTDPNDPLANQPTTLMQLKPDYSSFLWSRKQREWRLMHAQ